MEPRKLLQYVVRRITEIRESKGLSLAEAAARHGSTVENWKEIEYGHRNVQVTTVARIASALGVPIRDLFPSEEEEAAADAARSGPVED